MDKVVHFEIPADELERAQKFYKSVFSWEMNAVPGMEYIMVGTTPLNENPGYRRQTEKHKENGGRSCKGKNAGWRYGLLSLFQRY